MQLATGLCAQLACIWEATACKAGNVHRHADFKDLLFVNMLESAAAIAPILEQAASRPVGVTVYQAIQATRTVAKTNTNLGIVLLLSHLAAVPRNVELEEGLAQVLGKLTVDDSLAVYDAIRMAGPGAMGRVESQDISEPPTASLSDAMRLAAERDLVARQITNGFAEVIFDGCPALREGLDRGFGMEKAIILAQLRLMSRYPDSLIARKLGLPEAIEAGKRAQAVLDAGWPEAEAARTAFTDLDRWMRADGHKRNPGTTADLLTACLFVLLRESTIPLPASFSWQGSVHHA